MEIVLSKQAEKYLKRVDTKTRKKLDAALDELSRLEGDIVRLKGTKNRYRYKIEHYRILFEYNKGEIVISVIEINTRTNVRY